MGLDGLLIIKISCDDYHKAALTDEGELFTWYDCPKYEDSCFIVRFLSCFFVSNRNLFIA